MEVECSINLQSWIYLIQWYLSIRKALINDKNFKYVSIKKCFLLLRTFITLLCDEHEILFQVLGFHRRGVEKT